VNTAGRTGTTDRVLWCPKGPDGDLRLSMLGATMWLAWGQLEGSSGDDLSGLQRKGWRVVQVRVQEMP
jgi:hypothetical protein